MVPSQRSAPDVIRFGITPLYIDCEDIERAVELLHDVYAHEL